MTTITAALLAACLFAGDEAPRAGAVVAEEPPAVEVPAVEVPTVEVLAVEPSTEPPGVIQRFLDAHGDFLDDSERAVPNLWVSATQQGEAELGSLPGAYELERQVALARIPMPVHEDAYVVGTLYYHRRRYNVTEPIPGLPGDETVHGIELGLATRFWVNPDLMVHPFFYAGIYSDLDGSVNSDDWQLYGGLLANYRWSDTFFLRGGVAASQDLEHVSVFPLLGFYWHPFESVRVGLLAPFEAHVAWWPAPWCELLLQGTFNGFEHHVRAPRAQGKAGTDWRLQEYRVAAGPVLHLGGGFRISVMAGAQVTGGWDTRGANRNSSSVGAAPMIRFGIGWRVPTGE